MKRLLLRLADSLLSRLISSQAWLAEQMSRMLFRLPRTDGNREDNLSEIRRVLVVHLFEIGDVIMLTPFLRELRRLLPSAWITLVVKPEALNLVAICPHMDEVIAYNVQLAPAWRPLLLPWRAFWMAQRRLIHHQFDLAIVPSWQADNSYAAFLACFSGARRRIGYSEHISKRRRRLNRGFNRLFTETLHDDSMQHEVRHGLAMLTFLGGTVEQESLELWLNAADEAFAHSFWEQQRVTSEETVIALCPTAGHSALKQWPLEHFARLAQWLHQEKRVQVLVVGGPGDTALGVALQEALGPAMITAVGKTTLRQMAVLLTRCRCFVGNDAGPMHVAAAMGIPTVALFGSSCQHRYGPWGEGHTVISHELPCSPCGQEHDAERCRCCIFDEPRCLTEITVEEAQRAILPHLLAPSRRLTLAGLGDHQQTKSRQEMKGNQP